MQIAPIGFCASSISPTSRSTSGLTAQRAPSLANEHRFLAAPKPPGKISASSSAARTSGQVADGAAGDPRAFGQHVARFGGRRLGEVIDHAGLRDVGSQADRRGAGLIQGQQRQDRLLNLRTVHDAAAR
jgi:hypothetical protein